MGRFPGALRLGLENVQTYPARRVHVRVVDGRRELDLWREERVALGDPDVQGEHAPLVRSAFSSQ